MKLYIPLFILFGFSIALTAQPVRSISYETMLEVAEESLQENDYLNAIEWYDKAYKESKDPDLAMNIAQLSFLTRNYAKASKTYARILKRDKTNVYKEDRIMLAKSLKAEGKYKEALAAYTQYIDETEDEDMKQVAFMDVLGIQALDEFEENISTDLQFMDKKINTASAEASPSKYTDGNLYYSSYNTKSMTTLDGDEGDYFSKIYTITIDEKGKYEKPTDLGDEINRAGYHTSNPSFSKDGSKMYFTRSLLLGNEVEESEIYVSKSSGSGWGPAKRLGINGDFIAKHPAMGQLYGNQVLFFAANIEGGEGGFDLYYATDEGDDNFATPVNLGPSINTMEDEFTPFYAEGTLYFSSAGYPSMGGQDIYFSAWDGAAWSDVTNMGYIYNSPLDDMHFNLSADGSGGYLVSNRPDKKKKRLYSKTCCDDVFEFQIRPVVIDLEALIVNEAGEPVNEVTFHLVDETMDRDTSSRTNIESNKFNFLLDSDHNYTAIAKSNGYMDTKIDFNTIGLLDDYTVQKTLTMKAKPKEVVVVAPQPEVEIVSKNQTIRLNNIYYDFDDDKILTDAEIDLEVLYGLMQKYPTMTIELSSHTDAQGVSTYNKKLSQRRADSAKRWLVGRGISGDRITPVGYGEKFILNQCTNGVRCADDEHRVNRRTEFKMLEGPETIEINRG